MNQLHSCSPRPSRHRAFTLIELLIVIAVIGILAALIFPVFSRIKETGRRTACASNMKQLGMAFQQYIQDNSRRMPNAVDGLFGAGKKGGWTYYGTFGTGANETDPVVGAADFDPTQGSLYQYTKNSQIYVCPSDSEAANKSKQSYAANACVFSKSSLCPGATEAETGKLNDGTCRNGKNMVRFRDETTWMLLSEEARNRHYATQSSTDDAYLNLKEGDLTYNNYFSARHNAGSNLLFLDGHVKWYTIETIKSQKFQIGGPTVTQSLADGCPAGVT
ncbi:MAG TPA: prepilin-type N-terminal cleavage/methylation domain-containing protein [Abditibacteriaceae bacterium]